DFGSGTGDFADLLSRIYAKVLAFDISEKALNVAEKRHRRNKKITFCHSDAIWKVQLEDATLDLILSVTVLNHIMDDESLLATIDYTTRTLKPEGYLLAFEHSHERKARETSSYQRFLTFEEWKAIFAQSCLDHYSSYELYHPTAAG